MRDLLSETELSSKTSVGEEREIITAAVISRRVLIGFRVCLELS